MTQVMANPPGLSNNDQQRFAQVVTEKLRESRRRQKLTQADVANRTKGLVSKAALANYETGSPLAADRRAVGHRPRAR